MKKIIFTLLITYCTNIYALEDKLMQSMEMMKHANEFQAERLKVATENIANENSTSSEPGGKPYRRKIIIPKNEYNRKLKTNIVDVKRYAEDMSDFKLKYEPHHPAADENGYVLMPNVDRNIEKADALDANRAYEAGLSVMEISKSMIQKTLETLK